LSSKGIEVEILPGVCSISFTVISGHNPEKYNWEVFVRLETLEVDRKRQEARRRGGFCGKRHGREEKIIFSTLKEVAQNQPPVGTPSLYVIGPTVGVGIKVLKGKNFSRATSV
jgi:hypothetical protein